MLRVFDHTSVIDVEDNLKVPWTKNKAISNGNGSLPQEKSGFGKHTMMEIY